MPFKYLNNKTTYSYVRNWFFELFSRSYSDLATLYI